LVPNPTPGNSVITADTGDLWSFSPVTIPVPLGSIFFDSSNHKLTVPASDAFNFGTDPFTMESWFYTPANIDGTYEILDLDNGGYYLNMELTVANTKRNIRMVYNNGSSDGNGVFTISDNVFLPNTWTHLCLMRSGNTLSMFVNGVCTLTTSGVFTWSMGSSNWALNIGANSLSGAQANRFNGNLASFGK
jgi:hypothetical protein